MNAAAIAAAISSLLLTLLLTYSATLIWRYRKKDRHLQRGVESLQTIVEFLQSLNQLPLGLETQDLQGHIWNKLQDILRPMDIHCRLWIVDQGWKTLRGVGALDGGSATRQHLPITACPALQGRRTYRYRRSQKNPCASESFAYGKHLCLPLIDGHNSFGVLFLATDDDTPWDPQQLYSFDMLAQAIALSFQRRLMFDKLQEKISELHFSFEVGASALTTFGGSTQSLEETTLHTLDTVISVLRVERATFMAWDPEQNKLTTQCSRGNGQILQTPLALTQGQGMAGWALQSGRPYWSEYAMGDPHYERHGGAICSLLCVPLFSPDHIPIGVINAMTLHRARTFAPKEVEFLTNFGRLAALAMENAQLHQKSRHSISHLSEVSRLKSHFFSLVSHDLRGPLTGIRGFSEVLKLETLGPLNTAQMNMLENLENQVVLQERMVDDLLDYARMEKGKLSISKVPVSILDLITEEIEKSQHQAHERGITLSGPSRRHVNLPVVAMDAGRIRQVLWNLIFNALKFTPDGGAIKISVAEEERHIMVNVTDTGIGLSPETQEQVFNTFFQITPGGSKGSSGLGLGLAICKEIIESHGGHIQACSQGLGLGTTVRFSLPLEAAADNSTAQVAA